MNKTEHGVVGTGRPFGKAQRFLTGICLHMALALCFVLAMSGAAWAQSTSVLLVPFSINAAPDQAAQLASDLPALLERSLSNAGFRTVVGRTTTQDPSRAKELGRQAGTEYAVYGTFSQVGSSFNLTLRLVEVNGSLLRPYSVERNNLVELSTAVSELAAKAYGGAVNRTALADVRAQGLNVLDPDRILVRVASRPGDPVNVDAIDEDVRRIWDMGYFSDVRADIETTPQGDVLVFTVVEKPRIDNVRVQGSNAVKIGDITEAMSSRTGTVLNERLLADDLRKVTDLYQKKGYYLADVNYEVVPRADNASATLILHVNEGNKLYIKDVVIEGLQDVNRKDFNSYLALKKRGLFSWITGSGVLKEDLLERDSQAIQAYLVNQGYIDAQVSAPEVLYEEDGIRIVYRVREGQRYQLGQIGFVGDLLDTEDVLLGIIKLDDHRDKNRFFSLEVMQEDVQRLTEHYNDYGYAFADVDVDTNANEAEGILDIYYVLNPRERVYVRRVEVEGNSKTRDNVILREMRLADGQEYSGAALRRSTERLERLRYFDQVDAQLIPTGVPGEVDLKVGVEEGNTGMINVGFGYSTYDKFGVAGGISESNLFGRGYRVGIQGYLSSKETSVNLSFVNPRLWNTNLGFGVNVYAMDEEWTDFDKRTVGSQINFSYPIGEYTAISWGYRLDYYNLRNVMSWASRSIKDYEGDNWASVVNLGISRDTTNSVTFPTRGTKASATVEYGGGGLGGSDNFVKPMAEWGGYYGLNETNVLHARATVGAVFKNRSSHRVPAFERFYLGGMRSIRGYTYEDISPRDKWTHESIGANRMGYANFEYIWGFKQDIGMSLVPFFDIGVATDAGYQDFFDKVYYSTGLEVRWLSPMGDLRFAYSFPLARNVANERRSSGRFEFTMGQAF